MREVSLCERDAEGFADEALYTTAIVTRETPSTVGGLSTSMKRSREFLANTVIEDLLRLLTAAPGESRGGISPPRAPRTVREPRDSHGSRTRASQFRTPIICTRDHLYLRRAQRMILHCAACAPARDPRGLDLLC
jgi:hypothetical protein